MTNQQITDELEARGYSSVRINSAGHIWASDRPWSFVRWISQGGKLLPCDIITLPVNTVPDFKSDLNTRVGFPPRAAFGLLFPRPSLN